jgi:isoamylase
MERQVSRRRASLLARRRRSDLYEHSGRRPYASINFITCHDGFTLQDLVSYNDKQNDANGEGNRDGERNNNSWNCGIEGPTDDPAINALRARQKRNFLATLILSQGVPMICAGDEFGRTQQGNNNAYCQDNELSWLHWNLTTAQRDFLEFCKYVIQVWRQHPVFRRRQFFQGRKIRGAEVKDLTWFEPNGREMTDRAWNADATRSLMVRLSGDSIEEVDARGERIVDDTFLLLLNAHEDAVTFTLPPAARKGRWERVLDTGEARWNGSASPRGHHYRLRGRALAVLCAHRRPKAPLLAEDQPPAALRGKDER